MHRMNRPELSEATQQAIRRLRDSKPWRGTFAERLAKFQSAMADLTSAYGIGTGLVFHGQEDKTRLGDGAFMADTCGGSIVLVGKLSVVTFLFCFASALKMSRTDALAWSHGVFRHYFPRSYAGCRRRNGLLVRDMTLRN